MNRNTFQVASSVLVVLVAVLALVDAARWLVALTALVCVLVGLGALIAPRSDDVGQ